MEYPQQMRIGLRRSFQVIDEMLTSADPEFANLIHLGVLEGFSGSSRSAQTSEE